MTLFTDIAIAKLPQANGAPDTELLRPYYPEIGFLFDRLDAERDVTAELYDEIKELKDEVLHVQDKLRDLRDE